MQARVQQNEDLSRFRFHTGATLRKLAPDEPCRLVFRDIGPIAMASFLRGQLKRLAGPYAPILYTRTAEYQEPYVDYEPIGRLVLLQPKALNLWFSGVPTIYVASIRQTIDLRSIGFVPASIPLRDAERQLEGVSDLATLREVFGSRRYDEIVSETLCGLDRLNAEHAECERTAEPLRIQLQSRCGDESEAAREWLARHHINERDLCSAWHHLPRDRRSRLREALSERAKV